MDAPPIDVDSPRQAKALAHPMRMQLLMELPDEGATISGLAQSMQTNKGNVAHHLRVLQEAGLVRVGRTRTVRGGTERYFVRTIRRMRTSGGEQGQQIIATLSVAAAEMAADRRDPLVHLRQLRLSASQAEALSAHLEHMVDGLEPAPAGAPDHGVLVAVYRRPPTVGPAVGGGAP
ncbi:helix-turn-helix domain-containing protein [Homoserinibacter sp. GY 40078]|uniref:winged helix-turn-helix domain-containing protein n=1 Tax=Homoserinibacter sp. GY 40078 TaxID=2603275 RepID=UPI0011C71178|nr:helix-turn-helix domain-containing protein [Homoserinibacter sp. GY 40078]TXK18667.1 helix-turn-helix transcriptional regulator [Homoserinibacter sp. GY 40078]